MKTPVIVSLALAAGISATSGAAPPDVAEARRSVRDELRAAREAGRGGDPRATQDHLERAVAIAEARLAGSVDEANAVDALAWFHLEAGHHEDAAIAYARSVELYRKLLGPDQPRVAVSWFNLAAAEWRAGRTADAAEHARRAVEIWDRLPPERRAGRDDALQLLANLAWREGRDEEARRLEARRDHPVARERTVVDR